jgi:hypothetical protein
LNDSSFGDTFQLEYKKLDENNSGPVSWTVMLSLRNISNGIGTKNELGRFGVFTTMTVKNADFWDITMPLPCGFVISQNTCLHDAHGPVLTELICPCVFSLKSGY